MPPHSTTHRTLVGLTARPLRQASPPRGLHAAPCPPGFKVSRRDSCLPFLARPPASQSVLHCCTLHLTPGSGLTCCNLQQRPVFSAKLLQQSSEKYLDIVASARRSGQEDFQRGTPPVSLASPSISPFLRACTVSYTHLTLPTILLV